MNIFWIRKSIEFNNGLPKLGQMLSCFIVISCAILPVIGDVILKQRLIIVVFTLFNLYNHLSIS